MLSGTPDWDLLALAPHDDVALGQLFERHKSYVFRVAWGILGEDQAAEDSVQDIFLKLRSGKLKATPKAKFTTWLCGVAINTAREHARKRRKMWGDADAVDVLTNVGDGTTDPDRTDQHRDLARALATLPIRQREVVVLRFYEGFDTAETAKILGCRQGTVKAHLHRATLKLRETLSPHQMEIDQ